MFQPKLFDEFIPEFTAEELDNYYDLIQKGWWDEFCEDIHFYGAEDELYRQTLKELPKNLNIDGLFINRRNTDINVIKSN